MTNWLNARLNLLSEILVIARTIYQNKINAFLLVLLILAGSTYSLIMYNYSIQGTKINIIFKRQEVEEKVNGGDGEGQQQQEQIGVDENPLNLVGVFQRKA